MARRDYIGAALKELIDPTAKSMGFKRHGKTYFRVVGEMFQSFALVRFGNCRCSYRFVITPICAAITSFFEGPHDIEHLYIPTKKFELFGYYVDEFVDENGQLWGIETPESINRTAQLFSSIMHEQVFPLFERTTDVTTAFEELAVLSDTIEENLKNVYFLNHGIMRESHGREKRLNDGAFWFLALRNLDFEFVRNKCESSIKHLRDYVDEINDEVSKDIALKKIDRYQNIMNRINNEEYEYFYNELEQNELRSKEFLTSKGWKFE